MESDIFCGQRIDRIFVNKSTDSTDLPFIMSTLDLNSQRNPPPSPETLEIPPLITTSTVTSSSFMPETPESPLSEVSPLRTRRKSSEAALHRLNRRVIKKPKKNIKFSKTIFEEEEIDENHSHKFNSATVTTHIKCAGSGSSSTNRKLHSFIGGRKLRRSISFSDGLNIPKTTIQTRRKRIKRLFGRHLKLEKISMDAFLTHLRSFGFGTMAMVAHQSSNTTALLDCEPIETQSDIEYSSCETSALDDTIDISISNEV